MGYAPVKGLNMYYEVYGAGPPLLMLHGRTGSIPENGFRISRPTSG
jgi:pimeloyl-ACP methyl ester carboxylesterase